MLPGMAGPGNLQFEPVTLKEYCRPAACRFGPRPGHDIGEVAFPLMDHGGEGMMLAHVRKVEHVQGRYLVHCQFVGRLSID